MVLENAENIAIVISQKVKHVGSANCFGNQRHARRMIHVYKNRLITYYRTITPVYKLSRSHLICDWLNPSSRVGNAARGEEVVAMMVTTPLYVQGRDLICKNLST